VSGVAAETLPIRHEEQSPPDGDTEREMSEENVELVHAVYDRLNVGGAEAVRKLLDPDVVFKEPPEQPGATAFHGMDAAIEGFGKWSENWEMHRIEPERLIDLGDRVLSLEHHRLRGRDGVEVEADSATIWTLRRGRSSVLRRGGIRERLSRSPNWSRGRALGFAAPLDPGWRPPAPQCRTLLATKQASTGIAGPVAVGSARGSRRGPLRGRCARRAVRGRHARAGRRR
jgi:ketosteroid isomerase-like protein